MNPVTPSVFENLVSKPRLQSYKGYFHARSLEEAIGLYMWNCELTAAFGSLMGLYEVVLRNSVHRALSLANGTTGSPSIHWYDTMRLPAKTLDAVSKIRKELGARTPDEIVSATTFGFWPAVLKAASNGGANAVFPQIFPAHPYSAAPGTWSVSAARSAELAFLTELNTFRNRLAHHEPLWKFAEVRVGGAVIVRQSLSLIDSLAGLRRILGHLDAGFGVIDPSFQADIRSSSWVRKINLLLSERGVRRYRSQRHIAPPQSVSPANFRRGFSLLVKANQPLRVQGGIHQGIFIPD